MARSLGSFHEAHRRHGWEEIATEDAAMLTKDGAATRKVRLKNVSSRHAPTGNVTSTSGLEAAAENWVIESYD
jgi:hypothetical protein